MFFDTYPLFLETSKTHPGRGRLNMRYEAIFTENKELFDGARVLDIASHDGRWSLAALASGAKSVIGIEGREHLAANAAENLQHYGYTSDRFRFIVGDLHQVLNQEDLDVDVVLCLGFLYHTLRYNELLHGIRRTNAHHVIIDTSTEPRVMLDPTPSIKVHVEGIAHEGNAVRDSYAVSRRVLVGQPNLAAIQQMMGAYGYRYESRSDWRGILQDNPELRRLRDCVDYSAQARLTLRFVDDAW